MTRPATPWSRGTAGRPSRGGWDCDQPGHVHNPGARHARARRGGRADRTRRPGDLAGAQVTASVREAPAFSVRLNSRGVWEARAYADPPGHGPARPALQVAPAGPLGGRGPRVRLGLGGDARAAPRRPGGSTTRSRSTSTAWPPTGAPRADRRDVSLDAAPPGRAHDRVRACWGPAAVGGLDRLPHPHGRVARPGARRGGAPSARWTACSPARTTNGAARGSSSNPVRSATKPSRQASAARAIGEADFRQALSRAARGDARRRPDGQGHGGHRLRVPVHGPAPWRGLRPAGATRCAGSRARSTSRPP